MDPIIKLENVNFTYDEGKATSVNAMQNVNLEIARGEYVAFFGPSGCGKSTSLYVIAGVEKPTSGKVIVNGQDLMTFSLKEVAIYRQIGIGIIFQNFNLIPSIKVLENVTLPMAFLGISLAKRKQRAMEILERLGVADLANRFPFELSGGQQQRIGIARALANDPPIILADEPLGNLDSANANNVLDLLREFHEKDGKTIIMVTHEAWSLRDVQRVFYMRDGAIQKVDSKKPEAAKKTGPELLKNLFPELPPLEVQAKMTASLILRGYSQAEIRRLEGLLAYRLSGKITKEELETMLDKPYAKGGLGLWRQKAKKITQLVEEIIKEKHDLEVIYQKLQKNPEAPLKYEIEKMRNWILEDFPIIFTPLQMERLNEVIGERIRNIITSDNLQRVLDLPKEAGGVGLRTNASLKIVDKIDTILGSQMSYTLPKE